MRDELDMTRVWTPWELRGSIYTLDWIAWNDGQPTSDYDPRGDISTPLTVAEIAADDPCVSGDLIRFYAYSAN